MACEERQYQNDIIDLARAARKRGVKSVLITSPTGSGKTVLSGKMLAGAAARGLASWFIVHRRELVRQSVRTFSKLGIRYGVVAAGFMENPQAPVQICSIGTLVKRQLRLKIPALIVWDECHHVAAGSWSALHRGHPRAFHVGLSATPERLDGQGLGAWFDELICGPSVAELISQGYLSKYKLFAPNGIDVAGVRTKMGDFVRSEIAAAADRPTITGDAVKHYLRYAAGKRALAFCATIDHSKHVAAQFNAAGVRAAHVDGETYAEERDETIARFEAGELDLLCNVDLFGEGFDVPAVEAIIGLRPTQSLAIHLQIMGRALRPSPGKEYAVILDHAGNTARHGLPDDERSWSLDGRKKRGEGEGGGSRTPVKTCRRCFAVQGLSNARCNFCGYDFSREAELAIEQVEGELVQVDPAVLRLQRQNEQAAAGTLDALIELAKRRGYRQPKLWAEHVHLARQRKSDGR